ncbi:MAG: hypothetical protein ABIU10_00285 [Sphingomicrobium sp.]
MRSRMKLLFAAMLLPASAFAADAPRAAIADQHRLSEAEVRHVLDKAALKRESLPAPAPQTEAIPPPPRPIEGEVGVSIGTGGYREVFGTAVVPIGTDGVAIISIDSAESNRGRSRRRR